MKKMLVFSLLLTACSTFGGRSISSQDEFLWLEEVEGARALSFAKEHNEATLRALKASPHFPALEKDIRKISLASDRLPYVSLRHGMLYNLWQDSKHVRGLWRRTTVKSYRTRNPDWETVLDLDKLAEEEGENWVWKGANCLEPAQELCMISLSRGGKDASVQREFDLRTKAFVKGGFTLPEAKSDFAWISENEAFLGTDFGPGSLTDSGYPMIVKRWRRGQPLAEAVEVFRGERTDVSASGFAEIRAEGTYLFFNRQISFYEAQVSWSGEGETVSLPMPSSARFMGEFQGQLLFLLRADLSTPQGELPAGSLVAMPLASAKKGEAALADLRPHFVPTGEKFLHSVSKTRSFLLLGLLDKVKGRIVRIGAATGWKQEPIELGDNGVAEVSSADSATDFFLAEYTDYLNPTAIYGGDAGKKGGSVMKLKAGPARFSSRGLVSEQWEATSKDGTKIPYFIVHKKTTKLDGKNPTLLYGYGGFEVSLTPYYSGIVGKSWLERGGVYVVANIRGGGEFGPRWHEAAILKNKQKSYDDFIAVAEDLIRRKVTAPRHLGIQGGSNGGLLVGATFVQRPDLFNAVLCEVPLLDMFRYHRLLAGASWMAEYGDPEDPAMNEVIGRYSPFQNVRSGVRYPEVFFFTSTKDDRVHPGHARRMVARMESQGHKVHYYENTEGGHGGAANLEQSILRGSLEFTYLWDKLK
jgi:prolyl oligopeptidase